MRSLKFMSCILLTIAVLGGCASADKRFNQGSEMEAKGQYEQAVMRYVQALEKDPGLEAARYRLVEVGNMAIADQMAEVEAWTSRGDPVNAAGHFQRADQVVARARSVGVRLDLPSGYSADRRAVFDDAFGALTEHGMMARQQGRWQDGVAAFRRAQRDFEPSVEQRNEALAEESDLYVQWSEFEFDRGHWRESFAIAARVQDMEWSPVDQSEQALGLMNDCLIEGELELVVLPVQAPSGNQRDTARESNIANQIETDLWQGPWRQPPPFVVMHEALTTRDLLTHSGVLDGDYNAGTVALILRLAEADYGAHLQILNSEVTEFDVDSKTKNVKTKAGKNTTFVKEDGQRRIQATARVVIVDGFGNEIANEVISGSGTAAFARGVYNGDPRTLNLSARQVDLFDRIILKEQKREATDNLVRDLATEIADTVFGRTLAQVQ